MFGTYYNHQQFRRFLVAFGQLFDNIQVLRKDNTDTEVQRFVVPIDYGPKERWFQRLAQDPDFTKGVNIVVPRMTYEMTGMSYASDRKLNSLNSLAYAGTDSGHLARMFVGTPYTMNFELNILSKNAQDGLQIIEQIIPYFTPDLCFKLQTLPELNIVDLVPVNLVSLTETDNGEGEPLHRRLIVWTLVFAMKVYFYGPIRQKSRIQEVIVDLYTAPLGDLATPPEVLALENDDLFELEDGSGHLVAEDTANTYLTVGRVARIDTLASPNQDVTANPVTATTTITETSNGEDVKRTLTFPDEVL